MKTVSTKTNMIWMLSFLSFILGSGAGAWFGFKSILFVETHLITILLKYKNLVYPQAQLFFGGINLVVSIVFILILSRVLLSCILAVREGITLSRLFQCLGVTIVIGIFIGIGYLGLITLVMNMM